jgi:hypothetical protein
MHMAHLTLSTHTAGPIYTYMGIPMYINIDYICVFLHVVLNYNVSLYDTVFFFYS